MILVHVPRGTRKIVEVPPSVEDRSCKGTLHFRSNSTKTLTVDEWNFLEKNEPELIRSLQVIKRDAPTKEEAEAEHGRPERLEARKKQKAMPSERFAQADKATLTKPAKGKPTQPVAGGKGVPTAPKKAAAEPEPAPSSSSSPSGGKKKKSATDSG